MVGDEPSNGLVLTSRVEVPTYGLRHRYSGWGLKNVAGMTSATTWQIGIIKGPAGCIASNGTTDRTKKKNSGQWNRLYARSGTTRSQMDESEPGMSGKAAAISLVALENLGTRQEKWFCQLSKRLLECVDAIRKGE